ncbi:MAG: hypothetical protein H7Z10_07355 [Gemmatimonadaceae bacterium]|nr:hypothetical protein [Acetobacteraceae bacterium]
MIIRAVLLGLTVLLPAAAQAQQQRGLNLQAVPPGSALLPVPLTPPRVAPQSDRSYDLAPTPNRDLYAPLGPRASGAPELAPSLFTRGRQYRGEGFSEGSTAQSAQDNKAQPGAGFRLRMPLQSQ